ncbi:hypothetical protein ASG31_12160 [Chryseobacterium sp. Leaf404]|uniref:hypothetical protein n=1 Tax=unclassified Chryseobacterium TaxID=2593645 RepID=UPI0006F4DDD0|nr:MULTISPECIES: hypothetical protein [unclassified Chryseobacterium]KQT17097.1 hypothetical protein ASG31_12160 [Chryseobacterium sp. Leaf404]
MYNIFDFFTDPQFLRNIISAIIGTGTALLIFYLTTKRDKKKDDDKKEEEINNRISNFVNLLNLSRSHALNTIQNLSEMINNYSRNNVEFQLLRFSPNKSFDRLDENLKNENYFQAFAKKYGSDKIPNYNRLTFIIDYFNIQLNNLWEMVEKAQEFDYQRKVNFNDLSKIAINKVARLTIETNNGLNDNDIEVKGRILVDYHENMQNSITHNYVYLRRFLEEGLRNQISNSNVTDLIELIKEVSELYNEIISQIDYHKESLTQIRNEMHSSLETYNQEINAL